MTFSIENALLLGSIMLFLSIIASKTSFRLGIPSLVLFLVVGMLAGSDGPGGIFFNDFKVAKLLGVAALNFILFSGGLETKWESIRPIIWQGLSLSTIGVLITAIGVGVFTSYLMGYSLLEGLLLGAIVSSTDAAAVFSILRSRKVGLKGNLRPLLEFESGSNDPMAYFITIGVIFLLEHPEATFAALIPKFFKGMAIGALAGYASGRVMTFVINRIRLDIEGLYPVLILSLVFFTYSFTDFIGGNGFLSVYIGALLLGNSSFLHKKSLIRFYDGQAWLMQIVMFLTLGLLVFPHEIVPLLGPGIIISAFLIFVARPVAVMVSLVFFPELNIRKKFFLSWVGLRGAVPIIFAMYPLIAGIPVAKDVFNLVFFISVSSVLLQGTTLTTVARWLRVAVPEKIKRKFPLDFELKEDFSSELVELDIPHDSPARGKVVMNLNLPRNALIVLIHRDGKYITVNGETEIISGDHLLVMADSKETVQEVADVFGTNPAVGNS